MASAGQFEVLVSDPYPCWIAVSYRGKEVMRFRHDEFADLEFALRRAKSDACRKLTPGHASELL